MFCSISFISPWQIHPEISYVAILRYTNPLRMQNIRKQHNHQLLRKGAETGIVNYYKATEYWVTVSHKIPECRYMHLSLLSTNVSAVQNANKTYIESNQKRVSGPRDDRLAALLCYLAYLSSMAAKKFLSSTQTDLFFVFNKVIPNYCEINSDMYGFKM